MTNVRPIGKLITTPIPEPCIHPHLRDKIVAPTQVRNSGVYPPGGVYPFMNWAGSKAPLMKQYASLIPEDFSALVVGCLGGGSDLLYLLGTGALKRKPAVAIEANRDIWNLWVQLQQTYPQKIVRAYKELALEITGKAIGRLKREELRRGKEAAEKGRPFEPKYPELDIERLVPQDEFLVIEEEYDEVVQLYNQTKRARQPEDDLRQAVLTLYLSKTAYNGLYRVRKTDGGFNTPWGERPAGKTILAEEELIQIHSALQGQGIEFIHGDFELARGDRVAAKLPRKGVYGSFDPPYESDYAKLFTAYTRSGWGRLDTYRLAVTLRELDRRGWCLLLSNAFFPDVADTFGPLKFNRATVYRQAFMRKKLGATQREMRAHVPEYVFRNYRTGGDRVFMQEAEKLETLQNLVIRMAGAGIPLTDAFRRMSADLFIRPGEQDPFSALSLAFTQSGIEPALAFRALADLHGYQDQMETAKAERKIRFDRNRFAL